MYELLCKDAQGVWFPRHSFGAPHWAESTRAKLEAQGVEARVVFTPLPEKKEPVLPTNGSKGWVCMNGTAKKEQLPTSNEDAPKPKMPTNLEKAERMLASMTPEQRRALISQLS